jgi:hypothetical protein
MQRRKTMILGMALSLVACLAFASVAGAQQASITRTNCNNALCNANDTPWDPDIRR